MNLQQFVEISLPEKVNEMGQRYRGRYPMVSELEMLPVKKLDMLHDCLGIAKAADGIVF